MGLREPPAFGSESKPMRMNVVSGCVSIMAAAYACGAFGEVTAPALRATGFINGGLNVWVTRSTILPLSLEVQMKDANAAAEGWSPVIKKSVASGNNVFWNEHDAAAFCLKTNFVGTASLRMRTYSNDVTSSWVELGELTAYVNASGTLIGNAVNHGKALDGDFFTLVDEASNPWIGQAFDKPIRVKGIRYFSRPDPGCYTRIYNSRFEHATDDGFTDATTAFTITASQNSSRTNIVEYWFAEPVSAKAVRHTGGTRSSVCEYEIIPADIPYKPAVTVARDDITNFYPVVSWTCGAEMHATSVRVQRSIAATGPYESLTDWLDMAQYASATDTTAKVGIPYFYRVEAVCQHPMFPGQNAVSAAMTCRRLRRLDRAWGNESALLSGVTVMRGTNGVANTAIYRSFDGDRLTFPDIFTAYEHGPVGLDFGENVWVGAFGYVCRSDNYCYQRIKYAAVYSAAADDVELLDKVQRSDNVLNASQDTTFRMQDTTSIPAAGAPCWFLWGNISGTNDKFYGNVAEVSFFGWSQQDLIDSGIVTAPSAVSCARSADGLSVIVTWNAGVNVASYALQRRPRGDGDEAWLTVATVDGNVLSAADTGMTQGFWEYRVVAAGADSLTLASELVSHAYYTPGTGSGLAAAVYWPFVAGSAAPGQLVNCAFRGNEAVNISLSPDGAFAPGCTEKARLLWRGKLIAPFTGAYDFSLETSDGGAVFIDGKFVCNGWTGAGKTQSGNVNLTAGEHDIGVDARLQSAAAEKTCILRWGGSVPSDVIPATQLVPSVDLPKLEMDGWNLRTYNGRLLGSFTRKTAGYKLRASTEDSVDRDKLNASFLCKPWRGPFEVEAYVQRMYAGKGGIMVRTDDGDVFSVMMNSDSGASTWYGVRAITNGVNAVSQLVPWTQFGTTSNYDCYLKIAYYAGVFQAFWKDLVTDDWTRVMEWKNDGTFGREFDVGFLVTGSNAETQSEYDFSQISLKQGPCGTMITLY